MTNQEPGAPEPLTSEEERELRAAGDWCSCEEYRNPDLTRLLATLDAERAKWSWVHGTPHEHGPDGEYKPLRDRAALSHPESDTRGLDALARWLFENFEERARSRGPWEDDLWWQVNADRRHLLEDRWREYARQAARLSASPDLSIDREGLTVETLTDAVRTALRSTEYDLYEPITSPHGLDHDPPILAAAILAAIRGTSQPEPTE